VKSSTVAWLITEHRKGNLSFHFLSC